MGRGGIARAVAFAVLSVALSGTATLRPAIAQGGSEATQAQSATGPTVSLGAVLTIDPERLFEETRFGKRIQGELETRAAELSAENRRIEAELVAEERDLTERRASLSVDDFRALADAFDEKVDRIREEQDAKSREVLRLSETGRQDFLSQVAPVLSQLLVERGGSALLDRRNVFLSLDAADVTDAAIERIDAVLGDGTDAPEPE